MKMGMKLRAVLIGISLLLWFFLPKAAGLIMLLLGLSTARDGIKSRSSTAATGLGVLMFSFGMAMVMTEDRITVLTIGLSVCAVFLLRATLWEVKWVERNFTYLVSLSIFLALLPISEKFSALLSSLVIVLLINSTLKEEEMSEYKKLFENENVRTREFDESGLREFIETGDKAKLITYIAYHSPGIIPQEKLERIVRMILEYRDGGILGWRNKRRRKRLVEEISRLVGDEVSGWVR